MVRRSLSPLIGYERAGVCAAARVDDLTSQRVRAVSRSHAHPSSCQGFDARRWRKRRVFMLRLRCETDSQRFPKVVQNEYPVNQRKRNMRQAMSDGVVLFVVTNIDSCLYSFR